LGVAVESPTPPLAAWPAPSQLTPPAKSVQPVTPHAAPPWPRSAQWATAALLVLALGLLTWHGLSAQRWAGRPTTLEPNAALAERIDLNRADHAQLLQLPGVGEVTVCHIEEYRQSHNGFRDVEDLRQIHGIGPAIVERLRPLVYVEPLEVEDPAETLVPEDDAPPPVRPVAVVRKERPPAPAKSTASKKAPDGPIDVNRATAEELQHLPGVGPKLSARIVQTRELRPFKTVDELRRVPGIGVKTLEHLRPFVTVNE
jgi:competence ComEA-like helix-hairpin-helix protein